jgi:hypothetical protein
MKTFADRRRRRRDDLIVQYQIRQTEISKVLGKTFGPEHKTLTDEWHGIQRKLGPLLLMRDKERRPEFYRGEP